MKRLLSIALILGSVSTFGLVGCGDEAKVEKTETVTTPGGTTETKVEKSVESSGENPPPNSAGETAKPAP